MDKTDAMSGAQAAPRLTIASAKVLAEQILLKEQPSHQWVIIDELTIEKEFGWVFSYTSRKYWETKNPNFIVPGNGPLLIDRKSGAHVFLPTAISPENAIKAYEKTLKNLP